MNTRSYRNTRNWLLCAATMLAPVAAHAQDAAPAPDEPTQAKPAALGEIVVTATRRQESVQKVPISIQALTATKLEQHQVVNFADYVSLLPSVSYASLGPGRSDLYFRGISFDSEGAGDTGQQSVAGVYLDEIPMTTAGRMPEVHVYDMERVEALAGPQGTLFGSSSLSGTLRLITNKPKLGVLEGGYDIEANKWTKGGNNYGTVDEAYLNVPVAPNVAVRLVGYYDHTGGYIDNAPATLALPIYQDNAQVGTYNVSNKNLAKKNANPEDEYGGRVSVLAEFGDWKIMPQFIYQYLDAKGSYNYDPRFGDLTVHDFGPTENKDMWMQGALTITGKIGDFDIISSTGYFHRRIKNSNDYTYYTVAYDTPGDTSSIWFKDKNGNYINPIQEYYGDNTYNKFTQEVRISVPKSWPFALTAGVFYQWQRRDINEQYSIQGLSGVDSGTSNTADGTYIASQDLRDDAFYLTEDTHISRDYAFFAEGTYEIVPRLKLTGGIRLFHTQDRDIGFEGTAAADAEPAGCATPFTAPRLQACDNVSVPNPYHQSGETHKVSLAFQATPNKMVYATYSTGFRPGGNNTIAPNNPYKADTLSNYEIGFKTAWGPNFRLNVAAYYEKWKGVQYFVVPVGFEGNGLTLNAGDARVYGVESDFDWKIGNLTLSGSGSYNDARLSTNFCDLTSASSVTQFTNCDGNPDEIAATKGTRLPRQPLFKGQASARYAWQIGKLDSFWQISANHQSSSTSNLDAVKDADLGDVPGFTSADFSLGVGRNKWNVEFFMDNIFDTRGQLSRNTFCAIEVCSGSTRTLPSKPRMIGLKFSNKF